MIKNIVPKIPSREDKLLFVINEFLNDNKLEGRLKLMKVMFFLEHFKINKNKLTSENQFSNNEFIIYKHGPFSFEVMNDLNKLKEDYLITEVSTNHFSKMPVLTERGKDRIEKIRAKLQPDEIDRIIKIKEIFGDYSGRKLEEKGLNYLGISSNEKQLHMGKSISKLIH